MSLENISKISKTFPLICLFYYTITSNLMIPLLKKNKNTQASVIWCILSMLTYYMQNSFHRMKILINNNCLPKRKRVTQTPKEIICRHSAALGSKDTPVEENITCAHTSISKSIFPRETGIQRNEPFPQLGKGKFLWSLAYLTVPGNRKHSKNYGRQFDKASHCPNLGLFEQ